MGQHMGFCYLLHRRVTVRIRTVLQSLRCSHIRNMEDGECSGQNLDPWYHSVGTPQSACNLGVSTPQHATSGRVPSTRQRNAV